MVRQGRPLATMVSAGSTGRFQKIGRWGIGLEFCTSQYVQFVASLSPIDHLLTCGLRLSTRSQASHSPFDNGRSATASGI